MTYRHLLTRHILSGAAALGVLACVNPAFAGEAGIKVGVLTCNVDSGWGYVLGSSKDVHCSYHPNHGVDDYYDGSISKLGVDIGYSRSATIVWDVVAPTSDVGPGALEGDYGGATASATLGVGIGAHALLGGFDKSLALQPLSVEGNTGIGIAAGIGALSLRIVPPPRQLAAWREGREFTVYFDFNRAELTPEARAVVRRAARAAGRMDAVRISVAGHTDTVGSESYNDALSQQRAEAVKLAMQDAGADDATIVTEAHGFADPKVPTPRGVREGQNRRAVIDIEPGEERHASR